jgi:hypothetical protein
MTDEVEGTPSLIEESTENLGEALSGPFFPAERVVHTSLDGDVAR